MTVPLRACCPDCIHVTETCLKEGEHWQEKFSKGAHRRRSASLDLSAGPSGSGGNNTNPRERVASFHYHHHPLSTDLGPGFSPGMFSITVDEVDKRRRSVDFSADDVAVALHERIQSDSTDHERGSSSSSESSRLYPPPPKPSSSPIEEEDEDQLFPLPSSPRRSPSGSPAQSPSVSPSPSPNASTSCLEPALRSSSHDTLSSSASGSDEWTPKRRYEKKRFLTPEQSPEPTPYVPSSLREKQWPSQHKRAASSPASPTNPKRPSFSDSLLRVGADVLKGVGSINGSV